MLVRATAIACQGGLDSQLRVLTKQAATARHSTQEWPVVELRGRSPHPCRLVRGLTLGALVRSASRIPCAQVPGVVCRRCPADDAPVPMQIYRQPVPQPLVARCVCVLLASLCLLAAAPVPWSPRHLVSWRRGCYMYSRSPSVDPRHAGTRARPATRPMPYPVNRSGHHGLDPAWPDRLSIDQWLPRRLGWVPGGGSRS